MEKRRLIFISAIIVLFLVSIIFSIIYYNNKLVVSFDTGNNEILLNKYVKKGNKINTLKKPSKKGYVFIEWQLNGKKFDFNSKINRSITLTAKWIKEKYISIVINPNNEEKIKTLKILKGTSIDKLKTPKKDEYKFIGWYIGDKPYNNEIINDDATINAMYEEIVQKPSYKIGDMIKITDNYAESCYSMNSDYYTAIGWNRKILNIIEDSEYPFMIGDETGVTGFFKSDSFTLLN